MLAIVAMGRLKLCSRVVSCRDGHRIDGQKRIWLDDKIAADRMAIKSIATKSKSFYFDEHLNP